MSTTGDRVLLFDTTLRDGEQSPGATMTSAEKVEVARALSRLGVDVIEAGFPAASADDLEAVRAIAREIGLEAVAGRPSAEPPIICGLARATRPDIDKCVLALEPAARPRIHTFLATSPIHREHKLRMGKSEVLDRIREMVAYARARCADVEFSAEDAGRTELDFLSEAVAAAIEAGATTINVPDTVGYTTPMELAARIAHLRAHVPGIERVVLSVHCHDDLGLAVANTLAGLQAGARQAEVTINGIGERAGNASLEEVVMALRTRHALFGLETGIDATQLTRVSRLVSSVTGMSVQPNKAVVGANAFSHESGIHQDGMLKHEATYEIMRPATVGATQTRLVLGKHSGRHAVGIRLAELGYALQGEGLARAFEQFKALADRKKAVTDADLEALVASELYQPPEIWALEALQVACGTLDARHGHQVGMPTATVRMKGPDGRIATHAAVGTGPVDACFKAIDHLVGAEAQLVEYQVHAVTEGIDALGEVSVRIKAGGPAVRLNPQHAAETRIFHGNGADTDIIVASAKAYVAALNRLLGTRRVLAEDGAEAAETAAAAGV